MVSLEPQAGAAGTVEAATATPRHRADYILERGVWRVSCRVCGWKATDPERRKLASRFRFHLHAGPAPTSPTDTQR